jgi:hypothetical protein
MKEKKIIPMKRINTRIRQDQDKFIKSLTKVPPRATEGEIFRAIIDFYKANKK